MVAVDGKTVHRSFAREHEQVTLHVVSAFATQQGLSLGQVGVVGKGQELTAISVLPNNLQLNLLGIWRETPSNLAGKSLDHLPSRALLPYLGRRGQLVNCLA